jgi:hypothetical protein
VAAAQPLLELLVVTALGDVCVDGDSDGLGQGLAVGASD